MPSLYTRLRRLRRLPRRARADALAGVLPWAREAESDALVAEMLDLAVDPACRGLIGAILGCWDTLSDEARRAAAAYAGPDLAGILTQVAQTRPRAAAIALSWATSSPEQVVRLDGAAASALALALANGPDAAAAVHARRSLTALALAVLPGTPAWSAVDAALADQAARYAEHRDAALLEAVARLAPCAGPAVRAWMAGESDAGHMALRAAARKHAAGACDAVTALGWLAAPALSGAAMERMRRMTAEGRLAELCAHSHLLAVRGRDRVLHKRTAKDELLPSRGELQAMPVEARRGVARWLAALPISDEARLSVLAELLTDADAGVRLRAVLAIAALPPTRASDETLLEFALDADERVAATAAGTLAAARSPSRRAALAARWALLQRSPHAKVRMIAELASRASRPLATPEPPRVDQLPKVHVRSVRMAATGAESPAGASP